MQKIISATDERSIIVTAVGKNFKIEVFNENDGSVMAGEALREPSISHLTERINHFEKLYPAT